MPQLSSAPLAVVIPAAGVGKRMESDCPKQYLTINQKTILEHTVSRLLSFENINKIVIALGEEDEYFSHLPIAEHPKVSTVIGGEERVDSVLAGLRALDQSVYEWVLVHDAARPCVSVEDIKQLVASCLERNAGGLLGYPVRDTMKKASSEDKVLCTVERTEMWHALTPQMYPLKELISAIDHGLATGVAITDESSAIEAHNGTSFMIEGRSDNIKITRPTDLAMAQLILTYQEEQS